MNLAVRASKVTAVGSSAGTPLSEEKSNHRSEKNVTRRVSLHEADAERQTKERRLLACAFYMRDYDDAPRTLCAVSHIYGSNLMLLCAALFAFRLKWETAVNDCSDGYYLYRVACDRVTNDVIRLVESCGDEVRVSVDPGRLDSQAITDTHQIQLTYRDSTRTVSVDHDAFMEPASSVS